MASHVGERTRTSKTVPRAAPRPLNFDLPSARARPQNAITVHSTAALEALALRDEPLARTAPAAMTNSRVAVTESRASITERKGSAAAAPALQLHHEMAEEAEDGPLATGKGDMGDEASGSGSIGSLGSRGR